MSKSHKGKHTKKHSKEQVDKNRERQLKHAKGVRCIELDMQFDSFNACARYFGVNAGAISAAAHKGNRCKGYHFEIISNENYIPIVERKIIQLNLNYEFIKEYDNPKVASKELNISLNGILGTLNKKQKTSGGFIWLFEEEYKKGE